MCTLTKERIDRFYEDARDERFALNAFWTKIFIAHIREQDAELTNLRETINEILAQNIASDANKLQTLESLRETVRFLNDRVRELETALREISCHCEEGYLCAAGNDDVCPNLHARKALAAHPAPKD